MQNGERRSRGSRWCAHLRRRTTAQAGFCGQLRRVFAVRLRLQQARRRTSAAGRRRRAAQAQGGGAQGLGQQGGDAGGGALLYGGARRGSRAAARLAGPDGPHAGLRQRSGLGRASGSAQSGRVDILLFFSKYFSVQKQIQEMPRKCLEARKIPRKSQKFQENS
jgi:hypothetical protein